MAVKETKYKPLKDAEYRYQKVIYSHVPIGPAEPLYLTADPWSFLHSYLHSRIGKSRGENAKCYTRAQYYSSLAEDYYKAAISASMPAKGTLIYYGMLNLVKALLSVHKIKLETVIEHHGLASTSDKQHSLTIFSGMDEATNIFAEFVNIMGTPVACKKEYQVRRIVQFIPELHGVVQSLNFFQKRKFLPIKIELKVNNTNNYLMTELSYEKGLENVVDSRKLLKDSARKSYFKDAVNLGSKVIHRSKRPKKITKDNWSVVYGNIIKEYADLGIASLLTRNGYRYYCSLDRGDFHHLCNSYLLMFYLGHTARYRPTEMKELLDGPWRPVATEAVSIIPKQFLYQIVSLITSKLCVVPYSEL